MARADVDDSLVEQLMLIPGVENIHATTWEEMRLDYSDAFRGYIANHPMQEQISALSEQDIEDNFNGFLIGVDGETLTKYVTDLETPLILKHLIEEKLL